MEQEDEAEVYSEEEAGGEADKAEVYSEEEARGEADKALTKL